MIKTTAVHQSTTPRVKGANKTDARSGNAQFVATSLGMSWQLALAVLLPTIGGRLLDSRFGTTPVLALIGLAVGIAATVLIVRSAIKQLNEAMGADQDAGRNRRRKEQHDR